MQEIIAGDNQKDMNSWNYKLPKDAPEEVVVRYRRLLDLRRFCPLCKKVCMRRGSENAKWKIVGRHSAVHKARRDRAPICDEIGRAPNSRERAVEQHRTCNLKKKTDRRLDQQKKKKRRREKNKKHKAHAWCVVGEQAAV